MVIAHYTGTPKEIESYFKGRNSLQQVKLESSANEYAEAVKRWANEANEILDRYDH